MTERIPSPICVKEVQRVSKLGLTLKSVRVDWKLMYGSRRTCELTLIGTNRPTSGTVMPTPTRCAGAWTCAARGTAERATAQATATGLVCMGPPSGEWEIGRASCRERV